MDVDGITLVTGAAGFMGSHMVEHLAAAGARVRATALDTCGLAPAENIARLLPCTDLVLFHVKILDPQRHRRHTGSDNRLILENLQRIAAAERMAQLCEAARRWGPAPGIVSISGALGPSSRAG
ncbi:MAG: NAD-dependent epimerase/dehydratase family protein [Desulfobacteraceae bacterium]|jgi:pyruvate-formate lyase-activating enzyme|nr:NAD-dependent epimerase/dehydratase family protein [Desulfobacteraceae bacterium]